MFSVLDFTLDTPHILSAVPTQCTAISGSGKSCSYSSVGPPGVQSAVICRAKLNLIMMVYKTGIVLNTLHDIVQLLDSYITCYDLKVMFMILGGCKLSLKLTENWYE